jgi:hypothetical protein
MEKKSLIVPRGKSGALYYKYRHFYSDVLMAVVKYNNDFFCVDIGKRGTISDSGVQEATSFYRKLKNETLNLLDRKENNGELNYVFIRGIYFTQHLLKPCFQIDLTYE